MKKSFRDRMITLSNCALFIAAMVAAVSAAPPLPADLRVQLTGPANPAVYSPYQYTVNIKNVGGSSASNVVVVVDLPLTDTSPTRAFLGTLSGLNTGCSVVALKLQCNLGTVAKNVTRFVTFNFSLPVSSKALEIKATGSTSSNEPIQNNNTASMIPAIAYPSNQLVEANMLNSHCTGTGLTSYFECEMFPSSISHHNTVLHANGSITFDFPSYSGSWDQPTPRQLHFTYSDGFSTIAEFNGYASNATCFEGMVTFPGSNSQYVSPYRVCIQ